MLHRKAEKYEQINPLDGEIVKEFLSSNNNPQSLIDPKREFGEYVVGKLYTNPDVIDLMMQELGGLFSGSQAEEVAKPQEEEVKEVVRLAPRLY